MTVQTTSARTKRLTLRVVEPDEAIEMIARGLDEGRPVTVASGPRLFTGLAGLGEGS